MFKIENEFKDRNGSIFNIRNINLENHSYITNILGDYVTLSSPENEDDFELNEDGIYLYRAKYDKNKAIRLYKDHNIYQYTNHDDHIIVSKLQDKQKNIKLTEFPTGVITIENKIIGQEIPFYENSKTILNYFKEGNMKKRPTQFYLEILKILKELCNEDIYYTDLHSKNFLINDVTEIVNLIDFERGFVYFDDYANYGYKTMINNLKSYLLDILNGICNIQFNESYNKAETLEEIEEVILEKDYELKVK